MVLFRRLSVFAGGFSLETIEAMSTAGEVKLGDTLMLLGELTEQSLVTVEPDADSVAGARYGMLEPIR